MRPAAAEGQRPPRSQARYPLRPLNVRTTAALALAILLGGCAPGTRATSSQTPDFAAPVNWAALPWLQDAADETPGPTLQNRQSHAAADLFFIHPTTYMSMFGWNAGTDDNRLNNLTARGPIRLQASAFNGCCRVFAPRYRQAALKTFISRSPRGQAALDLAYEDVRSAFYYYLQHFDQGRPIFIAAHSQGSYHAKRLLAEVFDKDPALRRRLVAAYLIGAQVPCDEFRSIPPCDRPDQTGCFVSWSTYTWGSSEGRERGGGGGGGCCINPLTWRRDESYAPRELNLGGTPYKFDRIDPGITDAQCAGGKLWVHKPQEGGYIALGKNLHLMDYNLFYANIRQNAEARLAAFLRREQGPTGPPPPRPEGR